MPLSHHPLSLGEPALPVVARWLLDHGTEQLPDTLVLLPSTRACQQLGLALIEAGDQEAILLPRVTTPTRLADHLADLLGLAADNVPDPALRPLLLAPRLADLDWLRDRPEAAPGLAAELMSLFDEIRLAGQVDHILEGSDDAALLALADDGADEVLQSDLDHIRLGWRHFREVLPRDHVDIRVEALAGAARQWPGEPPAQTVAAHLGKVDQATLGLLQSLDPVHWLTIHADDPRSRLLLATYRDHHSSAHPLTAAARLVSRLDGGELVGPTFTGDDLPSRLTELEAHRGQLAAGGALTLQSCADPEQESRVVAATVCAALEDVDPVPEILVATADLELAARLAGQLRDAGIDVDDTRGRPLSGLPAGRLLRDLLRTVVSGWSFAPLFEVLTHPYVRLNLQSSRPGQAVRVQLLEAALRSSGKGRRGLALLESVARANDTKEGERRQGWSLADFVTLIAAAWEPLTALGTGPVSWSDFLKALRTVWGEVASTRPLDGDPDPRSDHDDIGALNDLLDSLERVVAVLPPAPLSAMSSALGDLMTDPANEVRPHRQRHLPVRLVGLVEARLEQADLLVVAGLSQDVFPGRLPRPLLLGDTIRRALDLDHWRARGGRDAELFLRLMHVAPRAVFTWPRQRDGQPSLPSPLVQRLAMVAPESPAEASEPLLYRRQDAPLNEIVAAEQVFSREPEPIPAPQVTAPRRLSHSAMQRYRECPYRFLLANVLGLRAPEPLEASFTPMELGNLAHGAMEQWLVPDGDGVKALAAGEVDRALASLQQAIVTVFEERGKDLPGMAVAQRSLLTLAPDLVDHEIDRTREWRPLALEAPFEITLQQVHDWLASRDDEVPALPADIADVVLNGIIDRVDISRDGTDRAAVIDYKTGQRPGRSRVVDGRELQVSLYALAVEVGGVPEVGRPLPVDHGGYYGLRKEELGLPAKKHLSGDDELVTGVRTILDQALAILDPDTPYALVPDWQDEDTKGQLPCRTCEFLGICRLEERDQTPALASRLTSLLTESRRGVS